MGDKLKTLLDKASEYSIVVVFCVSILLSIQMCRNTNRINNNIEPKVDSNGMVLDTNKDILKLNAMNIDSNKRIIKKMEHQLDSLLHHK